MRPRAILVGALACLLPLAAGAAPRNANPDWPCQQALVPEIAAATVWAGPPVDGIGDWHAEPAVAALVGRAAPRSARGIQRWRSVLPVASAPGSSCAACPPS